METENNSNVPVQPEAKKSLSWLWLVLLVIIIAGGGVWYFMLREVPSSDNSTQTSKSDSSESQPTQNSTKSKAVVDEKWDVDTAIFMANKTSTDTHKISDNLYRMFSMDQGGIYYAESSDCKTFSKAVATGVVEENNLMISNPAVLQVADNDWIMIYEMAPIRRPGQQGNSMPGPSNQRNLYLATSSNGKQFKKVGIAIDSSKEDNYFASVPDLVKTPDGKIRMYYVSRGDSIGSAISEDNGHTWTRESGYRLTNMAVDPDISIQTKDGKTDWVLYYTVLDPQRNGIYKTTSEDGLTWQEGAKILSATTQGAVVDADIVVVSDNLTVMFLGQSESGDSTGGETINLYRAELDKSIF